MRRLVLVVAATSAAFLTMIDIQADAAEVKVLGAVGIRQIMLDLGPKFERATGHTLVSTFGSSGVIVQRIVAGENFDVVMINRSGIESLAKAEKLIAGSATDLASSIAAVAVRKDAPKPDISSTEAFKHTLLSAKSIARPSPAVGGSSGDHIVKVLERLGIANEVNAKSVINHHPENMMTTPGYMVANGQAEMALHQLQELIAVPGIDIVGPFPGELQGTFVFSAGVTSSTNQRDAARSLVDFLRTAQAAAVIKAKGMEPVAP